MLFCSKKHRRQYARFQPDNSYLFDCTSLTNKNVEITAGKTDTLKFVLDTYGKDLGKFESEIRIITNTIPDFHKLKISAEIE